MHISLQRNMPETVQKVGAFFSVSSGTRRLPGWNSGKESACQCRRFRRLGFDPWIRKIPLEQGMAIHSSILAWKIPWTEEPGGLPSMGSHRVGYDWSELAAAAWPVQVDEWQNPSQYCKVITPQLKINIKNSNHVTQKNIYGIRKKLKLSTILKSLMEKINFPTKLSQLT